MSTAVINQVKELLKMRRLRGDIDQGVDLQKWVTLFLLIQRHEMLEGSCCREQ